MDAGIGRAVKAGGAVALLALAVAGARAQEGGPPAPPIAIPPASSATSPTQTAPAAAAIPPPIAIPPANAAEEADDSADEGPAPPKPPAPPPPPPTPERAPAAVLRVLDKVTAETMAFAAPVGQKVRYKSLVFEVKACETRGVDDPQPQPSAYLLITSDAGASSGAIGPRQVFKGWMFANAPSVHALTHPVYDAWLVACSAAVPAT